MFCCENIHKSPPVLNETLTFSSNVRARKMPLKKQRKVAPRLQILLCRKHSVRRPKIE
ncbi:hypothetical protein CHISP_0772 [Chitinispirillum alkaliphilum]|nr:hypothetical protein CHISP_0772 [Chitinispirillum alkaliphilum]